MSEHHTRWVVRLTPVAGGSMRDLLRMPLSMDVWERDGETLIVAMSETQLAEVTQRSLAHVERLYTVAEYVRRAESQE
jgi:hypothetical protein